jgi:hypothetical protein
LQAKEGLALINGTSMMTGIAAHAITEAQQLLRLSLRLHAFFIQALGGSPEPFDAFIHQCKPHPGQVEAARVMRQLLEGSRGLPSIDEMMTPVAGPNPRKVIQDRYSIRCLPQYMGPILDGMDQIAKQVWGRGPVFYQNMSGCNLVLWEPSLFFSISAGNGAVMLCAHPNREGSQYLFSLTPSCPFGLPVTYVTAVGLLWAFGETT